LLELVLADEATLLPLTGALRLGWLVPPTPVRWATPAEVEAAGGELVVTLASPLAYARLAATHVIVGDVAVVDEPRGLVALASERRPDELGDVEIDARDATPAAEALAAILRVQHFGAGGRWTTTRQPSPGAPARLAEGDAALPLLIAAEQAAAAQARAEVAAQLAGGAGIPGDEDEERAVPAPAGGHVEDLARAWFVLTGLPWVSRLLLAPRLAALAPPAELAALVGTLRESLRRGQEQERALLAEASARLDLPTGPLRELFRRRRYALGERERAALATFYQRAARYAGLAAVPELQIVALGAAGDAQAR
jgi:predicted solute-binding protein